MQKLKVYKLPQLIILANSGKTFTAKILTAPILGGALNWTEKDFKEDGYFYGRDLKTIDTLYTDANWAIILNGEY